MFKAVSLDTIKYVYFCGNCGKILGKVLDFYVCKKCIIIYGLSPLAGGARIEYV